jgi:calcyclin binding protein
MADSEKQVSDLEADLKELRAMLELSKRPKVRDELLRVQTLLENELTQKKAPSSEPQAKPASETGYVEMKDPPEEIKKPAVAPVAPPAPAKVDVRSAGPWTEITTFALDLGGYDKPLVTVDVRLKGIEALPKESITCDFTEASFDLKILGLDGTNYRFLRTNLDKDIVPAESEVKVKKNHVIVSLKKVKGEYGYDSWTDLCAKGKRNPTKKDSNPQESIMGMMKDLYDDGDDNMKKIIGEAMYKSQRGEKFEPKDHKMDDI